jgi:hypothetical protein
VREDINQSFGGGEEAPAAEAAPANAYLDAINSGDSAVSVSDDAGTKQKAIAAPKRGGRKAGVVDAKKGNKRGRKPGAKGRGGDSALREV